MICVSGAKEKSPVVSAGSSARMISQVLSSWCSGRSGLLVFNAPNALCCVLFRRTVGKDHEDIQSSLTVQSGVVFQ